MADRELRIRALFEGADRLTKPLREIAAGSGRLAQALTVTRERMKELEAAQAAVGEFRELKTGLAETEQRLAAARAQTTRLGRELAQTENPTKKLRNEFERARRESANLSTEHERQSARLQELRGRLSTAGISTRNLVDGERRLRSEVKATTDQLRAQEAQLQEVTGRARRFSEAQNKFSKLQGAATGLAAGGASAIGTGLAIAAPLTGAVQGSLEFQSSITDINLKVNQSREAGRLLGLELRKAALEVNQFPQDLQRGVDTLTGFGLGANEAVAAIRPIGRAATAYKADVDDLGRSVFAAYDNLKVPIGQTAKVLDIMAEAGKRGGFEIRAMAQNFPELTASLQSLGSTGTPAVADLAAALQITLKGSGDAASAANNLQNLLSKINAGDTIKNFQKFGIDIPAALKKAAKEGRSPIEEIIRLTQQATGGDQAKLSTLFGDQQVQQALRPLISAFSTYQSIRDGALNATGNVNRDFANREQDDAEKLKHLQIVAGGLSDTIGDQLTPVVGDSSERLAGWGAAIDAAAKKHPNLTRAAAVAAGALALLFIVVGGGAIVLAASIAPFAALSAAATALQIGLLPLIGIALAVVAGVAILAAAAYLIYANWNQISALFGDVWAEIKGAFSGGIAGIAALLLNFSPIGLIYRGIAALLNFLGISVPSRLSEAGSFMVQGLIKGIISRFIALKATVVNIANSVIDWFKEKLGIRSPSRVFAGLGGFVMAGLDQGLAANAAGPLSRINSLSKDMASALAAGAGGIAIATASPLAAQTPGRTPYAAGASAEQAGNVYSINVTVSGGAQAQDIADQVRDAIEKIERERRGRGFGDGE